MAMRLSLTPDAVILDAQRGDAGRLEQVAAVEDHQLFQACLDDAEVRTLEGIPFRNDDQYWSWAFLTHQVMSHSFRLKIQNFLGFLQYAFERSQTGLVSKISGSSI